MKCNLKTPHHMEYMWKKGLCYIFGYSVIAMLLLVLGVTLSSSQTTIKTFDRVDWSINDQCNWENYINIDTMTIDIWSDMCLDVVRTPEGSYILEYDVVDILDMGVDYVNIYIPDSLLQEFFTDFVEDSIEINDDESKWQFIIYKGENTTHAILIKK